MKVRSIVFTLVVLALALMMFSTAGSGTQSRGQSAVTSRLGLQSASEAGGSLAGTSPSPSSSPSVVQEQTEPPANPANCSQGTRSISVTPGLGYMQTTLLEDYNALGAAGGGTLRLGAGTYYLNETLEFQKYGNVSIQGAGIGQTILSLPPSPIGNFTGDNGGPVGVFNQSLGGPQGGGTVNFIQVAGAPSLNNFAMCNLTIDAQATNASEDWSGSLIMDAGGGTHHVYSDISEVGFFGPSGSPNGLHIDGYNKPALDYVVDNFYANNDSWPSTPHTFDAGGPNFLNLGDLTNCTAENITGIGNLEFEVAPSVGCLIENVNVTGHMLIDPIYEFTDAGYPVVNGSWGGTLFQNVTLDVEGTGGPNALQVDVANGTVGGSDFSNLRWNDDHFVGAVLDGNNMVAVTNSTFDSGLIALPAYFVGNTVTWNPSIAGRTNIVLPIKTRGLPAGGPVPGTCSTVSGNTFVFPNGTGKRDPFQLTVSGNVWSNDVIEVSGSNNGYLLAAPNVSVSASSSFSNLTYQSLGNNSPPELILVDLSGSINFQDTGAYIGSLTRVINDLPLYVPGAPQDLSADATSPSQVSVTWTAAPGPVSNYSVLVGENVSSWTSNYSAGLVTSFNLSGLAPATTYFLGVEAWNSTFHSAITGPVEVSTPPRPLVPPGTPTGLGPTMVTSSEVDLEWLASTGTVTNYTVLSGIAGPDWTGQLSVGNVTHAIISGLSPNSVYYFSVEAWDGSARSNDSTPVNVTTLSVALPPSPPSSTAPGSGGSMATLGWAVGIGTLGSVGVGLVGTLAAIGHHRASRRRGANVRPRSPHTVPDRSRTDLTNVATRARSGSTHVTRFR
jgi:Fibronectin type III domain